jgi:hypothetical protein
MNEEFDEKIEGVPLEKHMFSRDSTDIWSLVLNVHSRAALLWEGAVYAYAKIARMEGVTRT